MDWGEVSNDQLDEAFAHFFGLSSAGLANVCELIPEVDVRQSWMTDGARSLTEWVSARLSVRHETAGVLVRVARRSADLPVLSTRFAAGDLSLDQVDALSRMATPETEEGLVEEALGLSNAQLDRRARRAHLPTAEDERSVWERRTLYRQRNLDQSELKFRGNLPAAEGKIFDEAIDTHVNEMGPNPETGMFDPLVTRAADAVVELAATTGDTTGAPPQMTVFADLDALTTEPEGVTELSNAALIPNETARRLSCDCVVETVVTDGSVVVGVGRNSRTVPGWLRRLVHHRDGGRCRFPGCRNRRWLQAHHIHHWSQGGSTDLDNLILLCGFHHRFCHEHGWHITRSSDGEFVFRKPDWTPYPPPKPELEPRLAALVGDRCP